MTNLWNTGENVIFGKRVSLYFITDKCTLLKYIGNVIDKKMGRASLAKVIIIN